MSADVLGQIPTPFELGKLTYQLGIADYDLELYFQARHEAWARNRIEATRAMVGEQAYRTDCDVFAGRRDSNLFAFGSPLSLGWLLSDEGMIEYLTLISQKGQKEKGGAAWSKERLRDLKRDEPEQWERLVRLVVGRDFPNVKLSAPTQPATRPDTTNGSTRSSQENPGESPATRSTDCPAATS